MGADHAGRELKETIARHLEGQDIAVLDLGTNSADAVDYPIYGVAVGRALQNGEADFGILVCGSGQGMAMTANKLSGIRAAVCGDTFSARAVREHNDANILALGARVVGQGLALDIVDVFLRTKFLEGRHTSRLALLTDIENRERLQSR